MTLNLYVMPIIGAGTRNDPREPKYTTTFQTFSWSMFDYGDEPQCLVGVLNIDAVTDATLTANADVFPAPQNLDTVIGTGATLNRLRNGLESDNIPGTWITSSNTYRQVIKFVGGCCQFMQRYQGQGLPFVFQTGISLNSTFGSLSVNIQQGLTTAAQSFGFDSSTLINTNTLRTVIKSMADQYVAAGLPLVLVDVAL